MYRIMPPLSALRAFEAAARHLSLTKAALELHVTPGALSHQIRGLEALLGIKLFDRRVRSIALTPTGKQLYPGLQTGFSQIRDAVMALGTASNERVLVISMPPGFAAKWLAPRLHRFATAHPDVDARVSSSASCANFISDGVDIAIRNLPIAAAPDPTLVAEKLIELALIPVCSPKLIGRHGRVSGLDALKRLPLIHDDMLVEYACAPGWTDWFKAAGIGDADARRGLRFNSTDHALDATIEGAGVLLVFDLLAYDDLRTGRLVIPVARPLRPDRAYYLVSTERRVKHPPVQAFRRWIKRELAALDWKQARAASA